jgi:Tol biopolymer transport system component
MYQIRAMIAHKSHRGEILYLTFGVYNGLMKQAVSKIMKIRLFETVLLAACLLLTIHIELPTVTAQSSNQIERVSVSSAGVQANGNSGSNDNTLYYFHSISGDGRFIAFESSASNLVTGDTNVVPDIFVRDRQDGITLRVSVASNGAQANSHSYDPSISADGRFIAFGSVASNLVTGDTNGVPDIFVRDRQDGITTRVSVASNGAQANIDSYNPSISADGRYIAFQSGASNLVTGDTNEADDVFVHDRQTGQTRRVSVASNGTQANGSSGVPSISADGNYVAFWSDATNLVSGDTNYAWRVFVHNRQTGQTMRVSVASNGTQANGSSVYPSISADGRYVAFESDASNLVPSDTNGKYDIFVRDRQVGQTTRISVASDGAQANDSSTSASISADGRYVAFWSGASNLVPGDTNGTYDIFVHDRQMGQTTRISVAADGTQADNFSVVPTISADGRYVAFLSSASNLVPGDTNGQRDIFVATLSSVSCPAASAACPIPPELNVGTFRQFEQPWANDPYAWHLENNVKVSQSTIRRKGCFITSVVNIMHYWGVTTDVNGQAVNPRNMNDYLSQLTKPPGYVSGNLNWSAGVISRYSGGKIEIVSFTPAAGQTKEQAIDAQLALNRPVMVGVPSGGVPNGHWVVIIGPKVNGHYPIRDPGYLQRTNLGAYGDEIGNMRLVLPTNGPTRQQTIIAHSPVELLMTDSLGRRTGFDPVTHSIVNEIPGAGYWVEDPIVDQVTLTPIGEADKILHLPLPEIGSYKLTVTGTGNGHYALDFLTMDADGNLSSQTQEGIATTGSTMEYPYNYNGDTITLNQTLVANAGPDQILTDNDNNGSEQVTLNGSGSTGGTIASYLWLENGVTVATGAAPTLNLAVGTHEITLIVIDDNDVQSSDTTIIKIRPKIEHPPNTSPPRNYFATDTPTLTWNRIGWAAAYEIQVNNIPNFSGSLVFARVVLAEHLSLMIDHLPNGTYYWRVRAVGANGPGAWSPPERFVVDAP